MPPTLKVHSLYHRTTREVLHPGSIFMSQIYICLRYKWHHQLNRHEYEQTPGDSGGQRGLVCYSPRGCKESDMTQGLNNNKFYLQKGFFMSIRLEVLVSVP